MGCVTNSCFAVLINGTPSDFFLALRGIRQGCPLSPLFFILIIESLSRIIMDAQQKGHIKGFQYSPNLSLTHLLFVDNVFLFGIGTVDEWGAYKEALDLFCSATGMSVNKEKYSFLYRNVAEETRCQISVLLPYIMAPITSGFKYLGYRLKPLGYRSSDWIWMVEIFENKIKNWTYRLLALGGRLVLIKYVLTRLAMYWSLGELSNSVVGT